MRAWPLAAAAGLAALYMSLAVVDLTGRPWWEGVFGVVLGLFICSLPARHFMDMLIYWRVERPRFRSRQAFGGWVAANAAVLVLGWLVIVLGMTKFTAR